MAGKWEVVVGRAASHLSFRYLGSFADNLSPARTPDSHAEHIHELLFVLGFPIPNLTNIEKWMLNIIIR